MRKLISSFSTPHCRVGAASAVLTALVLLASPSSAQTASDLFNGAVLHDVVLRVNARDWDALKRTFDRNTRYPAQFTWAGITLRDVAIRSRGSGSRNGVKPGLLIEFDRYRDGQRLAGVRSVVLDNHWQDPSMMRERLSMQLYQRMGLPAPREAHARVFVNDEYLGVYALVENADEDFLAHHFGLSPDAIESRAYLFEYRWMFRYTFTDLGRRLEDYEAIFEPKIKAHKSMAELFGPIEDFVRTVNEAGANFATAMASHLDLGWLASFLAIGSYLADWDGFLGDFGMNNFFAARIDGRFAPFIPWDRDNAMVRDPADANRAVEWPVLHNVEENVLARKTLATGWREVYFAELLRSAEISAGWLEGEINREAALIRGAVYADPNKPFSNQEFEDAVEYLRRFARERPANVRGQVSRLR